MPRKKHEKKITSFNRIATAQPEQENCYLEQGFLCLARSRAAAAIRAASFPALPAAAATARRPAFSTRRQGDLRDSVRH